jgi:hypothetical protein
MKPTVVYEENKPVVTIVCLLYLFSHRCSSIIQECDDKCFSTMREDDGCGGWTESCEAKTCEREECRPAQPAQNACHEPPEQNTNTGDYCTNGKTICCVIILCANNYDVVRKR